MTRVPHGGDPRSRHVDSRRATTPRPRSGCPARRERLYGHADAAADTGCEPDREPADPGHPSADLRPPLEPVGDGPGEQHTRAFRVERPDGQGANPVPAPRGPPAAGNRNVDLHGPPDVPRDRHVALVVRRPARLARGARPVSYTHLTLPTIYSVSISVLA